MPSTPLHRNMAANAAAQAWGALMTVLFVPLYIRLLGIEAYGVIGIFAALQVWLSLLDVGLALALNREMARFTANVHSTEAIRDLLRSVGAVGLALAGAIAALVYLAAPWLATHWLQPGALGGVTVEQALQLMGVVVGMRVLEGLLHGALLGLQRQVRLSAASALVATTRWGGAALVLQYGSASLQAFYCWQVFASLVAVVVFAAMLHRQLPTPGRAARFDPAALRALWPFAAGVITTMLLATVLTQLDKLVLSSLLSLQAFAYYALATFLASAIQLLITPIAQAYYPRLSELAAGSDPAALARAYHEAAQTVSIVAVPVAMVLIFLGEPGLRAWTGNAELARATAPLLAPLALGSLLNGFMMVPYNAQLALGWSQLGVRVNTVAVALFVPALLLVAPRYGAIGAAWLWVALNVGYMTLGVYFMHRRLLTQEKWAWYARDVLAPLAAGSLAVGAAAWLLPHGGSRLVEGGYLALAGILGLLAAGAAAPLVWRRA